MGRGDAPRVQDGLMAGQLFKTLAVTLSDRIAEASSKMRTEVVAKNAKKLGGLLQVALWWCRSLPPRLPRTRGVGCGPACSVERLWWIASATQTPVAARG